MMTVIYFVILTFLLGLVFSPFPYWRTYWVLWAAVICKNRDSVGFRSRLKQASFLIQFIALTPLWTVLWYADELLFPGYRKVRIRPVFILGQARSGTTFLHRTLAMDKETFTAVRHFEWRYPFLTVQKLVARSSLVRKFFEKNYWPETEAGKIAARMHPNNLLDWEEDGIFFEERSIHHIYHYFRFPYPDIIPYLDRFPDLPPRIRNKLLKSYHKTIQKVLYMNGGDQTYYLSKEVAGHSKLPALQALYPDARFVFTLRRSSEFMSSLLPLVRFSTMSKTGVDPLTIPEWEENFITTIRNHSLLLVDLCSSYLDKSRQTFVTFDWLTTDVKAAVEHIYRQLDLNLSDTYRDELSKLAVTQKERGRGYKYDLRKLDGYEKFDEFVGEIEQRVSALAAVRSEKDVGGAEQTSPRPSTDLT